MYKMYKNVRAYWELHFVPPHGKVWQKHRPILWWRISSLQRETTGNRKDQERALLNLPWQQLKDHNRGQQKRLPSEVENTALTQRTETSRSMCIESPTTHHQSWKTYPNPWTKGSAEFRLTKNASTAQNANIKRHSTKAVTVTTFRIRLHEVRHNARTENATSSGITLHTAGTWKQTLENASFP